MTGAAVVLAFLSGGWLLTRLIVWRREAKRFARTVDEFHRVSRRGRR